MACQMHLEERNGDSGTKTTDNKAYDIYSVYRGGQQLAMVALTKGVTHNDTPGQTHFVEVV